MLDGEEIFEELTIIGNKTLILLLLLEFCLNHLQLNNHHYNVGPFVFKSGILMFCRVFFV